MVPLVLLLLALVRGVAWADPEEDAKRAFLDGASAYERGQYRIALKHYQRSLALMAKPRTLFNIAVCEQELKMFEAAYDHFDEFLRIAEQRDAGLVEEARARLRRLSASLPAAQLFLESDPPGAQIFIGDERVSRGAAPLTLSLRAGRYRVRAVQAGMLPVEREIDIAPRKARSETLVLERLSTIVITAVPADAIIRPVQSPRTAGSGRLAIEVLRGIHEFHISRPGYRSQTIQVEVDRGQTIERAVRLTRETGPRPIVSVRSNVAGAAVSLDGMVVASVAQTPAGPAVISRPVAPGDHVLLVERAGYRPVSKRFRIDQGQHLVVSLALRADGATSPLVWSLAGVSLAAFGTGAIFGVLALRDDADHVGQRAVDRAHAADLLMATGLLAGGAAYLLHRRETSGSTATVREAAEVPVAPPVAAQGESRQPAQ